MIEYKVFDKQTKEDITDKYLWCITPDGKLYFIDYDSLTGYPDAEVQYLPTTNADRIRCMTDEELADYLIKLTEIIRTCDICEPIYRENGECNCQCETGVLNWLNMEIE